MLKLKTDILVDFLEKVRMNSVDTVILNFKDDGLNVKAFSITNTFVCESILYSESFDEYESIGTIGVDRLDKLINVFGRMSDYLEFKVEGNLLTAKDDKKELSFKLMEEKFIDEKKIPDVDFETSFTLKGKTLKEFLKDAQKENKDVRLIFKTVEDGIHMSNTGKYQFKYKIDNEGTEEGVRVKMGKPFLDVFDNINKGEIKFFVKTDSLMRAIFETDEYKIKYTIAPLSKD